MILEMWVMCEERNKSQRENLKEKYSIIKKDELLEMIDCLKGKVKYYEYPEEVERYEKKYGEKFIVSEVYDC